MTAFNEKNGVPLGEGLLSPDGSVQDKDLSGNLRSYKARVAGSYRAVLPEEITSEIKAGKYWVSPKVDGELWFLILVMNLHGLSILKGKSYLVKFHFSRKPRQLHQKLKEEQ